MPGRTYLRGTAAAVAVVAAFLLRHAVVQYLRLELPPFIFFYPSVMIAGILAGFWAGLLATLMASLLAAYFIFPPHGQMTLANTSDIASLAVFFGMGVFMSWVAERYRHNERQIAAYRKEAALRGSAEKLRQSEKQFEMLANAIPQLCWMANPDGWIFWYNQRWYEYTGTTPQQMEGWAWQSVHDPESLPRVLDQWQASITSGEPFDMVFPLRGADGAFRTFLTRVMPVKNEEGKVVRWFGTNTDISEQKQAEAELRKSQQRIAHLASFPEVNPNPVFETDLEGKVTYLNPAGLRRFPTLGKAGAEQPLLRDFPTLAASLIAGKDTSIVHEVETDGRVLLRTTNYVPEFGVVRAYLVDITERKRAEEALRESEELLKEMGRIAQIGGWEFDVSTGRGRWTEEVSLIHDLEPNAPINVNTGLNYYYGDSRPRIETAVRKAVEKAQSYDLELEILTAKGVRKWVRTIGHPVVENGKVAKVRGSLQDITERKRAQEALQESEAQLSLFIEHAPAALAMFDREMRYLRVSRRWLADYGLGNCDLRGLSHYDVFPEVTERWKEAHRRGLAGEVLHEDADRFDRADGSAQWIRWEIRPWHNAEGGVGGILIFTEDITKRKQSEEALLATLEERTALLKEVHHRVKNNLQIVSSLLNLQARQEKNQAALETLRDTQGRIRAMALLHESLYREGNAAGVNCAVYFSHLCAHLCRAFGQMADQVRVSTDIAPVELGLDFAIPCGLIVNELVSNSFKHAFPDGRRGEIAVSLNTGAEGRIVLSVADDGIGLESGKDYQQSDTLGTQLITGLAKQIAAAVEVKSDYGTMVQISFVRTGKGRPAG